MENGIEKDFNVHRIAQHFKMMQSMRSEYTNGRLATEYERLCGKDRSVGITDGRDL
jgi:hypothetical protein